MFIFKCVPELNIEHTTHHWSLFLIAIVFDDALDFIAFFFSPLFCFLPKFFAVLMIRIGMKLIYSELIFSSLNSSPYDFVLYVI